MGYTTPTYTTRFYSNEEMIVADGMYLARKVSNITIFFELDITALRNTLKQYNKNKKTIISITTALLFCYIHSIIQHPRVLSFRRWRKVFTFNTADIFFPMGVVQNGQPLIKRLIIRQAQTKTIQELEQIINASLKKPIKLAWWEKYFLWHPGFYRRIIHNIVMCMPKKIIRLYGNAYFSAVHNVPVGNIVFNGLPQNFLPVGLFASPHRVVEETINGTTQSKTIMGFSLSVNHEVANGLDLVKLCSTFKKEIENFTI